MLTTGKKLLLERIKRLERELEAVEEAYTYVLDGNSKFDIMDMLGCSEEKAEELYRLFRTISNKQNK